MTSEANIDEGNNVYVRTHRPGTGRSHSFSTFGTRNHVQVDPRVSYSDPSSIDLDSSWYAAVELQQHPNVSPRPQAYQSFNSFRMGNQAHSSLALSSFRRNFAHPQLVPIEDDSHEIGPPILGIDISVPEVDSMFREAYNIPNNYPVNLNSICDPPPSHFTYAALAQLAIWSSPQRRLTLAEIYTYLESRFAHFRNPDTMTKSRGNIRHLLSLKKCFIKSDDKQGARHYWCLDYRYLKGGDKRERKRGRRARGDSATKQEEINEGFLELDEGGSSSRDDSSTSSSSPPSNHSLIPTFAPTSTTAGSSDMRMIRHGPGYPSPNTPSSLPRYDPSYSTSGGRQSFYPASPMESVPPGHQYTFSSPNPHQSSHSPYHAHAYLPAAGSSSERSGSFGQSHFPPTA